MSLFKKDAVLSFLVGIFLEQGHHENSRSACHGACTSGVFVMSLFKKDAVLSFLVGFGFTATALLATLTTA